MHCIAYARFSTDRQDEVSIADQLRVCREWAERNGATIAREFTDAGISGEAFGNRPGIQDLFQCAVNGDVVLVRDIHRIARAEDLPFLAKRLKFKGVRLVSVLDGFDSAVAGWRQRASVESLVGIGTLENASRLSHSGLLHRAKLGKHTGGRAYGFGSVADGSYRVEVEIPEQLAIAREIFARFAAGETMREIAWDLNRRAVPAPGANWKARRGRADVRGKWQVSALHVILHNERYIGRMVWNRSTWLKDPDSGRRVRRARPQAEWIVREAPAVIDPVTWQRVQRRFSAHTGGRGGARRYLLSGILECGLCGAKLLITGSPNRRYVCGTYHGGGPHACANSRGVRRKDMEDAVLEPVMEHYLADTGIEMGVELLREARREAERQPSPYRAEIEELERLVRTGTLSRDTVAPALAAARQSLERSLELPWPSEALWRDTIKEMRATLNGPDVMAAREVLAEMFKTIRVRPTREPGWVEVELATRRLLMAVGTSSGSWVGSGGRI